MTNNSKSKALIVSDNKPGHVNQSIALCRALELDFDIVQAAYPTRLHKLLSYLIDRLGIVADFPFTIEQTEDYYCAVICSGSTTFYPGKIAALRRGIPAIAILYPSGYKKMNFDCILAPAYDRPHKYPHIIPIPINIATPAPEFYHETTLAFQNRHKQEKKSVGIVLGGPNRSAHLRADFVKNNLDAIFAATPEHEHWITTSRRTPPTVEKLLKDYPFAYRQIFSQDNFNPIPAFVNLCEHLFVTAESTSMLSEAVTFGQANVGVIMNLNSHDSKFYRFLKGLMQQKAAYIFQKELQSANCKINLEPVFDKVRQVIHQAPLAKKGDSLG